MSRFGIFLGFLAFCLFLASGSTAPAGMINQWSFEEGSGTSTADSVGSKTGTLNNMEAADWVAGGPVPSGSTGALDFDGTDEYVGAAGYYGVAGKNARTVTAWINTAGEANEPVVSWGENNAGEKWTFRVQDANGTVDGVMRVEVNNGYQVGTTYVSDNAWHHVAVTWEDDGANSSVNDARLWVDGVLEGVGASKDQAINTPGTVTPVRIGRNATDSRSFNGQIDEVRIFDHALTRQEIAADAGLATDAYWQAVQTNSPTAYWRLGEPSGGKAFNEGSIGASVDGAYLNGPTRGQPSLLAAISDNTAVSFDGSNDQVNIPDSNQVNTTTIDQASIETWFKTDTYDTTDPRVIYEQGGTGNGMNQYISRTGTAGSEDYNLRFGAWENAGTARNHFPTKVPIEPGTTYHAVSVYDNINDEFILYLNGAPVSAKVNTNIEQIGSAGGDIAIGAKRNDTRFHDGPSSGAGNRFLGTIDEVALYHGTVLDLRSIQTHYVTGSGDRLGITEDATLGVALNYDATIDSDGDTTWEDTIGTRNDSAATGQFDWDLGTTGDIPRVDVRSVIMPYISKAYEFDGSHSASTASFEKIAGNPTDESASFEIVFKPSDFTGQEVLFETGGSGDGMSITLDDSTLKFDVKNGTENAHADYDLTELSLFEQNDFIHVIGVADLDNDQALLYVNGLLVDTIAASGTLADWAGSDDAGLGGTDGSINFGSPGLFTGQIGLMRFYPSLLTADDVMANFEALVPEPSSFVLAALGLIGLGFYSRRRKSVRT